jgi:DNA-binding NarL/FixJ family response regulator
VYEALTHARPHRAALQPAEAADVLRREARAGRLDAAVVDAVLAAAGHVLGRQSRRTYPSGLSERELDVLRLLARGQTNRVMAATLSISESTVHHHIQHIYNKLGVSTRAAATLFAMQHGLL